MLTKWLKNTASFEPGVYMSVDRFVITVDTVKDAFKKLYRFVVEIK